MLCHRADSKLKLDAGSSGPDTAAAAAAGAGLIGQPPCRQCDSSDTVTDSESNWSTIFLNKSIHIFSSLHLHFKAHSTIILNLCGIN